MKVSCYNCRAELPVDSTWDKIKATARALGWVFGGGYGEDILCPTCSKVTELKTRVDGDWNETVSVTVSEDGIEIENLCEIDWDWIDAARAVAMDRVLAKSSTKETGEERSFTVPGVYRISERNGASSPVVYFDGNHWWFPGWEIGMKLGDFGMASTIDRSTIRELLWEDKQT